MIKSMRFLSLMLVLALLLSYGVGAQASGNGGNKSFSYSDNRITFTGDTVFFLKPDSTGGKVQILDMNPAAGEGQPALGADPELVKLAWIAAAFASRESHAGAEAANENTEAVKTAAETEAEAADRLHSLLLDYLPNVLGGDLAKTVSSAAKSADLKAASAPQLLAQFLSSGSNFPLPPDDFVYDAAMNAVEETFGGVHDPIAFAAAFVAASQAAGEDSMADAAAAAARVSYDSRAVEVNAAGLRLRVSNNAVVFANGVKLANVDMERKTTLIATDSTIEKGTLGGYAKLIIYGSALKKAFISDKAIATSVGSDVDVAFLLGQGTAYGIGNVQKASESQKASGTGTAVVTSIYTDTGSESAQRSGDSPSNPTERAPSGCGCGS